MNAIAFRRKPDPVGADGIVGAGLDREGPPGFDFLELVIRIVAIVRVGIDRDYLEDAAGRRLFIASHGRGKEGDQFGIGEGFDGLGGLVDLDARDDRLRIPGHEVRH